MPCPHIELRKQYIADLERHDDPYKFWQYKTTESGSWIDCYSEPSWTATVIYRRKPKTIRIGKFDVPAPLHVKPRIGGCVWSFNFEHGVYGFTWQNESSQCRRFLSGVVHKTSEDAEAMMNAIISTTTQNGEEE